jgi:hypothetical protein
MRRWPVGLAAIVVALGGLSWLGVEDTPTVEACHKSSHHPHGHPCPTTTTQTPTTTSPSGGLFSEDFTDDDIADFKATFDWSVVDLDVSGFHTTDTWQGHHNMACEAPTTERALHHRVAYDNVNPGDEFWLCGPGGPTTDHLMTSNGHNNVFGITAFSPKQSFIGNRVCWDVNLTESPGRRRWWEVQIVPASYVTNAISLVDMGMSVRGNDSERGTAYLAWGQGHNGYFKNRILPKSGLIVDFTQEMIEIWRGNEDAPNTARFDTSQAATKVFFGGLGSRFVTQDRATRAHHCFTDNGNGTLTIRQQRPGQADYVQTIPGSFPKPYRFILADHNYDAGKDGSLASQTFHWDNITIDG